MYTAKAGIHYLGKFCFVISLFILTASSYAQSKTPDTPQITSNQRADSALLTFDVGDDSGLFAEDSKNTPVPAILVSYEHAKLASQFAGEVEKINTLPGQHFNKKQILLTFKCEEQQANYNKAKAIEESAKSELESAIKLDELESISKLEVSRARSKQNQAMADLLLRKAILAKCEVRAPFNGHVVDLLVKSHETVKPGDPLMEVISNQSLFVTAYAPSAWIKWIKIDAPFTLKLKEYKNPVIARVVRLGARVDATSQTIHIYGKLIKSYTGLKSGMSGVAYFNQMPKLPSEQKQ